MAVGSEILKVLGDPARYRIVRFLAEPDCDCCGPQNAVCACDIESLLGLSQPTVSHHMKQLVEAGLVSAEKRGRWVYYELVPEALADVARTLQDLVESVQTRSAGAGRSERRTTA